MDKFRATFIDLFSGQIFFRSASQLQFIGIRWRHKKSELIIISEEASKHQIGHDHFVENPHLKESRSSSTLSEMDSKAAPSQTKISSTSVPNQTSDHFASSSSNTRSTTDFTNHGLILWTQTRQHWVASGKQCHKPTTQVIEPRLSWDATYDSLLGSDKPFPQAIPLSEMVEFLVDVWEQEGLYD